MSRAARPRSSEEKFRTTSMGTAATPGLFVPKRIVASTSEERMARSAYTSE